MNRREFTEFMKAYVGANPHVVKYREGSWNRETRQNDQLAYIEWFTVLDALDASGVAYSYEVKSVDGNFGPYEKFVKGKAAYGDRPATDDRVLTTFPMTVTVSIHVTTDDDSFTVSGIGYAESLSEMHVLGAEHNALKRAATKLGLARELYAKDNEFRRDAAPKVQAATASRPFTGEIRNPGDPITPGQLGFLSKAAPAATIAATMFPGFDGDFSSLTKGQASDVITAIKQPQ